MAVVVIEQETSTGSLAPAVKVRMEAFLAQVAGVAMSHPAQRERGGVRPRVVGGRRAQVA